MSIGQRIIELRTEWGVSRTDISTSCGVSDVAVGNWERDLNEPLATNFVALAKRLKTTPEWLATGQGLKYANSAKPKAIAGMLLPILTLADAALGTPGRSSRIGAATDWRNCVANVSESAFVVRPEGEAMLSPAATPPIMAAAFIIIDPNEQPVDGSIVLISFTDGQKPTLKKLVIDGPNRYLKSLNSDYKPLEYNSSCVIIGTVKRVEYDT